MAIPQPRRDPNVVVRAITPMTVLAVCLSALGIVEAIRLYTSHNAARCGGAIGWIGPGLLLYATGFVALLLILIAFVASLILGIVRRRWLWVIALPLTIALATLIVLGSTSQISHDVVGVTLGYGCSWFYPEVIQSLAPLLVAAPTLAFLVVERRRGLAGGAANG